jgi:hypothetical protein
LEHLTKLPVIVDGGSVGSLRVTVPWTSITSAPVHIYIDDIDISARSMNAAEAAQYFERRASASTSASSLTIQSEYDKQQQVQQQQQQQQHAIGSSGSSSKARYEPGWLDHTLRRIVNNVQVHVVCTIAVSGMALLFGLLHCETIVCSAISRCAITTRLRWW